MKDIPFWEKMDVDSELNKWKDIEDKVENVIKRMKIVGSRTGNEAAKTVRERCKEAAITFKEQCKELADLKSQLQKELANLQQVLCNKKEHMKRAEAEMERLSVELKTTRAALKPVEKKLFLHKESASFVSIHKDYLYKMIESSDTQHAGLQKFVHQFSEEITKEEREIQQTLTQDSKNLRDKVSELEPKILSLFSESRSYKYQIVHIENVIIRTNLRISLATAQINNFEAWLKCKELYTDCNKTSQELIDT